MLSRKITKKPHVTGRYDPGATLQREGKRNDTKKRKIIIRKNTSEAGLPVFREAVSAVDGPTLSWLERDFAFFTAVCTDYFCHFTGAEVSGTAVSAKI